MVVTAPSVRSRRITAILASVPLIVGGLALTRLLYEGLFPRYLLLGRPLPVLLLTILITGILWFAWFKTVAHETGEPLTAALALTPLLFNLIYLVDPQVNVPGSRLLFAGTVWLTAVFLARLLAPPPAWSWLGPLFLLLGLFPLYLSTMPAVVGRADTFEFQVAIPQMGIAHPTGYPLYMLLGRLFAALPIGSIAWRINLASAVFGTGAAIFVYVAGRRLWQEPLSALLAAALFGLTPTFWSQAIEAEVYALHSLIVAAVLALLAAMFVHGRPEEACNTPLHERPFTISWQRSTWILAFLLGLGLTNHLTTLILLPPTLLAVVFAYGRCLRAQGWQSNLLLLLKAALAFLLPLLLYAYLPLRWSAIHGEAMGVQRFMEWVLGGRFQGALQLYAWLSDFTRYEIVWRLLVVEWGISNLIVALLGLGYALYRDWRSAVVLLVTWLGYIFYALNYHVPDLSVFLIPAHIVTALFWGAGLAGLLAVVKRLLPDARQRNGRAALSTGLVLLALLPQIVRLADWQGTNYEDRQALQAWGEGVLDQPLAPESTILADSEKIAPLYYLQQAEGFRPDLTISVLPDEAAYRSELDARVGAGETVYLARFLPGLEGIYHLRSQGPLVEVSREPLNDLPEVAAPADLLLNGLRLVGYALEPTAAVDPGATAVTFYWQADTASVPGQQLYVRWSADDGTSYPARPAGAHPVSNYYPIAVFRAGEIVSDYHLLAHPAAGNSLALDLQVAAGPPFAAAEELDWHTVTRVTVPPAQGVSGGNAYRADLGRLLLRRAQFQPEIRPESDLLLSVAGYASGADLVEFTLLPAGQSLERLRQEGSRWLSRETPAPIVYATAVGAAVPNGAYELVGRDPQAAAFCGWLAPATSGCVLGQVNVSGVPLPPDAVNFDDKIALLDIELPDDPLRPGGQLPVTLQWQSLAPMDQNYTVFLQVLNEQDQIVGQVDAWPRQGTFPTSQWQPGERVADPYQIQLAAELPPGDYRLQVGFYLLATLRRLPVLDSQGNPVDDKIVLPGLTAD